MALPVSPPDVSGTTGKRAWLAALLCLLATGLGHLYLRRWRRGLGWFLASYAVGLLVVPASALEGVLQGDAIPLEALWPVLAVQAAAAVDAYRIAKLAPTEPVGEEGAESVPCPHCGKELDPDLDFCHWCTSELPADWHDPETPQ